MSTTVSITETITKAPVMIPFSTIRDLSGHYLVVVVIVIAYRVWLWLPWWIAAIRAATAKHDQKALRARKAVEAIAPPRHRPWNKP